MRAHGDKGQEVPHMKVQMTRHAGAPVEARIVPDLWPTCTYCGSVTVGMFLESLQRKGVRYSGCDWMGGPHKFYLSNIPCEPYTTVASITHHMGKTEYEVVERNTRHLTFYSEHMKDATPADIDLWNRVALPLLGVAFKKAPVQPMFIAPYDGWQTWGVVGFCREDLPSVGPRFDVGGGDAAFEAFIESVEARFGPQVPPEFLERMAKDL